MKVYFHPQFYDEYITDPAAETGRMEAIVEEADILLSLQERKFAAVGSIPEKEEGLKS